MCLARLELLMVVLLFNLSALAVPLFTAPQTTWQSTTPSEGVAATHKFKRIYSLDELVSGRKYLIAYGFDDESTIRIAGNFDVPGLPLTEVKYQSVIELDNENHSFTLIEQNGYWSIQQPDGKYIKYSNAPEMIIDSILSSSGYWEIIQATNNKFKFKIPERNDYLYTSKSNNKITINGSYACFMLFREVLDPVNVSISSVGYATLYYGDRSLVVPEGIVAKTYAVEGGQLVITKEYNAGDVIPQATAVVLMGNEGTYTFQPATTQGIAPERSDLYGYDNDSITNIAQAQKYYKLSTDNEGKNVGFYWATDNGGTFTSTAHKAFLAVTEPVTSKAFSFNNEVTAIESVKEKQNDDVIYSIYGVRMQFDHLPAGIYIKNGKKIIVK